MLSYTHAATLLNEQESIGPRPYPVIYAIASPARGLLDRRKYQRNVDTAPTKAPKMESGRKQETNRPSRCAASTRPRAIQKGALRQIINICLLIGAKAAVNTV